MSEFNILDKNQVEEARIEAERRYMKGVDRYDAGDIDDALMMIRSAITLYPTQPKYHYNLAYLYSVKKMYEPCITHYKLYLRYVPDNDRDINTVKGRIKYYENELKNLFKR